MTNERRERLREEWQQINDDIVIHGCAEAVLEKSHNDTAQRVIGSLQKWNREKIIRMDYLARLLAAPEATE